MSTVVLRNTKGSALTIAEADANINNLNTDKIEFSNLSVTQNSASGGGALSYNNGTGVFNYTPPALPAAGISNVVEDTSPQLGGELDAQGELITNPILKDYAETVEVIGSNDSPTLTVANGNVKTVTISSGLSLSAFTDAAAGQTITLIVNGSGSATGTGAYKFAGGNKTLTNDSIVSIHTPDGTNYFASIATDFQA